MGLVMAFSYLIRVIREVDLMEDLCGLMLYSLHFYLMRGVLPLTISVQSKLKQLNHTEWSNIYLPIYFYHQQPVLILYFEMSYLPQTIHPDYIFLKKNLFNEKFSKKYNIITQITYNSNAHKKVEINNFN